MVARTSERCRERVSDDRLSILHVTAPAPVGGLERVVETLARGHAGQDHRVRVLAVVDPGQEKHPLLASLSDSRAEAIPIEVSARSYLREARSIARHCRDFRPHVVHTHGYRPDVVDGFVARLLGHPVVTTVHGFSREGGRAGFYEWVQRKTLRWFDGVVAVSAPLVDELLNWGVSDERITLIPNDWSPSGTVLDRQPARRGLGLEGDARVVGWVGRMVHAKGPDLFLEAMARLGDPGVTASVVGDGPDLEACRTRAEESGVDDRVRFHGLVERAARYFRAFDVFVLSSRTEGTPIALLEAVAAGIPVVATRVGGVPDVLGPDEAYLVPPEDATALADAIREAVSDPVGSRRRADAARRRLENEYDTGEWLGRYERVYRRVGHRRRGGSR